LAEQEIDEMAPRMTFLVVLTLAAASLAGAADKYNARKNPKDGLKYVHIPAGTYTKGCVATEPVCSDAEKPAHPVTISKPFWIGQTEVTTGAYKAFAKATGASLPPEPSFRGGRSLNPSWSKDDLPIVQVTWAEAKSYCEWAGGRLPTAAEWEYAARAGATGLTYGDVDAISWNAKNSGSPWDYDKVYKEQAGSDGRKMLDLMKDHDNAIHPVGQKQPNAWGLYDVLGNVLEWVSDWDGPVPAGQDTDPHGPAEGTRHANRGASWITGPDRIRFTGPTSGAIEYRSNYLGLRCVLPEGK
jgi:sulfatase modifying factor 1